jgi:hypothetical protein
MLSDIKRYLSERGTASLHEIARHVDAEAGAVRGMLRHWVEKGRARELPAPKCKGCAGGCGCDDAKRQLYEWIG